MALIERTFGVGGDFVNPSAAWIWLASIDPLTDDYELTQVSDCEINNDWPLDLVVNMVDTNGHYVKFYCP